MSDFKAKMHQIGKGGENGREGRGRGHRDGRKSLGVQGGEGKGVGKGRGGKI